MSRPRMLAAGVALAVFTAAPVTPVTLPTAYCGVDALPIQRGPVFCRTGAGHPVHGRLWCLEKGFGLGGPAWRRADLGGLRLEGLPAQATSGQRLPPERVTEILGREGLGKLFAEADRRLERGALGGFWRGGPDQGVLVLEVVDGESPVAELTDRDLDGVVDVVLVMDRALAESQPRTAD